MDQDIRTFLNQIAL